MAGKMYSFSYNGHKYHCIDVSPSEEHIMKRIVFQLITPIFHPAVVATWGNDYGKIYGWSTNDVFGQIRSPGRISIAANTDALDMYMKNRAKFDAVNLKIAITSHCQLCNKDEQNRGLLFACQNGDVFHKNCLINKEKCPTCDAIL